MMLKLGKFLTNRILKLQYYNTNNFCYRRAILNSNDMVINFSSNNNELVMSLKVNK